MGRKLKQTEALSDAALDAAAGGLLPYIEQDNVFKQSQQSSAVAIEKVEIAVEKVERGIR